MKWWDTSGKRFVTEDCISNMRQDLEKKGKKRRDLQLAGAEERQRQETRNLLVLTWSRRALSLAASSHDYLIPYLFLSYTDRAEIEY